MFTKRSIGEEPQVKSETRVNEQVKEINTTLQAFRENPENYIDSILFRSVYTDEKKIKLSNILKIIREKANHDVSSDGMAKYFIKLASGDVIVVSRNTINAKNLFSNENFKANYRHAFQKSFPINTYKSNLFSGLQLVIVDDLQEVGKTTLEYGQILDFRFLTCLFFGLWFHIELEHCKCYPPSLKDWIAYSSGITKNCLNPECVVDLMNNPQDYDPLIHFDCTDQSLSYTFNMINQLGKYNTITLEMNRSDGIKAIQIKNK